MAHTGFAVRSPTSPRPQAGRAWTFNLLALLALSVALPAVPAAAADATPRVAAPSASAAPTPARRTLAAASMTARPGATPPQRHAAVDPALAADLLGWASRLSGLPSPANEPLPRFVPLPQAEIVKAVCPERPGGCAALVAVYDTDRRRVLYRDTLDMREPTDQSFIVHELVHHLQFLQRGAALFGSCQSTLEGESQAYRVQNLYQAQFRQWQRMGEVLRFMHCDDAATGAPVAHMFGPPAR